MSHGPAITEGKFVVRNSNCHHPWQVEFPSISIWVLSPNKSRMGLFHVVAKWILKMLRGYAFLSAKRGHHQNNIDKNWLWHTTQFSELQNSNMLGTAAVLLATSHFLPGMSEKPRKASENLAYGGDENQIKPWFFVAHVYPLFGCFDLRGIS